MPDANVHSGAMLGFKVGTQANVDNILNKVSGYLADHGTFYLATDTHRLYIGNEDRSLSPVNEGIITVETVAQLPSVTNANRASVAGNFYYVSGTAQNPVNILCVYNGQEWVQLNSNTDTKIDTFSADISNGTVTLTLTEKDKNNQATGASYPAEFDVQGANGISISSTAAGQNSNAILTVTGNTYSIGTTVNNDVATVNLTSAMAGTSGSNAPSSSFKIKAGNNVDIVTDSEGMSISSTNTINSITDVSVENAPNSGNGFVISVAESGGSSDDATLDPVITYGQTGSTSSAHFVGGTATLDVYTTEQIDEKMQGLDAMHYRGTIGTGGSASTDTTITYSSFNLNPPLKIGDTFKLSSNVSVGGNSCKANTIIIANGTEYTESTYPSGHPELIGTIDQSTLTFDIIQATADTDTTYTFKSDVDATNGAGIILKGSSGSENSSLHIKAGTAMDVSGSDVASNQDQVITVAHANVNNSAISGYSSTNATTTTQALAAADTTGATATTTIYPITSVTVNEQGHVTAVERTRVDLKDTNADTAFATSTSTVNSVSGNVVTITDTVTTTYGNGSQPATTQTGSFQIASDNLTISNGANTNEIKINLVWGSF